MSADLGSTLAKQSKGCHQRQSCSSLCDGHLCEGLTHMSFSLSTQHDVEKQSKFVAIGMSSHLGIGYENR